MEKGSTSQHNLPRATLQTLVCVLLYRLTIRTLSLQVRWCDAKNKARQRSPQLLRSRQISSVTQNNIRPGHRWKCAVAATCDARVMRSFAHSWKRRLCWEILRCLDMRKKLTERHKVTDNPCGSCYLLMTAAAAFACTKTTHKHAALELLSMNLIPYVLCLKPNEMRNGWRGVDDILLAVWPVFHRHHYSHGGPVAAGMLNIWEHTWAHRRWSNTATKQKDQAQEYKDEAVSSITNEEGVETDVDWIPRRFMAQEKSLQWKEQNRKSLWIMHMTHI